jgi:hypothetical protein
MLTGVFSSWGVWQGFFERYTRLLMDARPEFPIHFLKIYSCGKPSGWTSMKAKIPLHLPHSLKPSMRAYVREYCLGLRWWCGS